MMGREIGEQLTKYLSDAHSIEEQALAQLRTAPDIAVAPELAQAFRTHLTETEGHERTTRNLLEARGAAPSKVKDAVMALGGKGFLLFARLQPDTPGELFAHALSYEGLEFASYELLLRVAERAGEEPVVEAAARIRDEEREMIQRLESLVTPTVEAALRQHPRDDLSTLLRKYLADAHAIEEQAIALLERAPKIIGDEGKLESVFSDHLAETRDHAELVQERLHALGDDPSTLKDAAMRLGALNWGTFFQGHPDTAGKLTAFAYAFEHLEIGGYEQLRRVAERANDSESAQLAERHLRDERNATATLRSLFPEAAGLALAARS
jgi:ferritin-like metal-binding protein YciE